MSTAVRVTVADFDRLIEQGAFDEQPEQRYELIHGEVRPMPPPNPPHEDATDLLNRWSCRVTREDEVRVRIQNSLGIPELDSVPLPDVVWTRAKSYRKRRPQPNDVLLVIEVAESSLAYDRGEKAELFASAGIKDYWIVNLIDRCIEVYRKPRGGKYREHSIFRVGESLSPLAFPDVSLEIAYVFGK